MYWRRARVVVIVGDMGYGKTYFSVKLCQKSARVLIIDPKSYDPGDRVSGYDEPYGLPGAVFFNGPLEHHRNQIADVMGRPCFTIVFRRDVDPAQVINLAERFGNLHFHFDELNLFRDEPDVQKPLRKMIQASCASGITFSCCTQRPQGLPPNITDLYTELRIFRTTGPLALEYLQRFDANLDIDKIKQLPRGEHVCIRKG